MYDLLPPSEDRQHRETIKHRAELLLAIDSLAVPLWVIAALLADGWFMGICYFLGTLAAARNIISIYHQIKSQK